MADLLVNRLDELMVQIDRLHLMYLELEDSPKKIEQREKLEQCVKEFLYLAPHDMKFVFRQTSDVLHRSASTKDNFSGYRAGLAFKAVGKYADNLLAQPWRKEYREIKLYCGFYKHEIESNLVGAELMLEAMGYRHAGDSTMILPDILDPDRITNASKDALTAYVECQIMKHIWESLYQRYKFSWLDILEFRENHTGTADQAIKSLTYRVKQRQYQEQSYLRQSHDMQQQRHDCYYGQNMMAYNNHVPYLQQSYSHPVQTRFMMSPQAVLAAPPAPQTMYHTTPYTQPTQHVLKPQDLYPNNGYHIHSHYQQLPPHTIPTNGYPGVPYQSSIVPTHATSAAVPTAQLIEVEMTHQYQPDPYAQHRNYEQERVIPPDRNIGNEVSVNQIPSGRAKEDGAGSWEHWDYVYKNLESQGYRKDMGLRGDLLSPKEQINTDLCERVQNLNLDTNDYTSQTREVVPTPVMVSTSKVDLKSDIAINAKTVDVQENIRKNEEIVKDNVSPSRSIKSEVPVSEVKTNNERTKLPTTEITKVAQEVRASYDQIDASRVNIPKISEKKETEKVVRAKKSTEMKWECVTCTYLNCMDTEICEMCSKSKNRGAEQKPQPSGGSECPRCTLVNERGTRKCAACDATLENSPTYI